MELAVGEMCNVVKETYGGDKGGFIAGQVFRFSGFVSAEGSLEASRSAEEHYVIVTYWRSFEEHEKSHADTTFTSKFEELAKMCSETQASSATTCCGRGRRSAPSVARRSTVASAAEGGFCVIGAAIVAKLAELARGW